MALMAAIAGTLEHCAGEAWKATEVNLVGSKTGSGAHGVVVGVLYVRQLLVLVVLLLIDDHQQHARHDVVNTVDAIVAVGVKGACSDFERAE